MRFIHLALLALVLSPAVAHSQSLHFGFGAGPTILTGTPERPAPANGESLTGAGSTFGWNAHLFLERDINPAFVLQSKLAWNRLSSDVTTFNCLGSQARNDSVPCYPAAKEDRAISLTVGARIRASSIPLSPYLGLAAGAAQFRLVPDNANLGDGLKTTDHILPVYRLSLGTEFYLGESKLLVDATFMGSVGRGGGTHHFPLSISWRR
jgi:hypothetical protein